MGDCGQCGIVDLRRVGVHGDWGPMVGSQLDRYRATGASSLVRSKCDLGCKLPADSSHHESRRPLCSQTLARQRIPGN